MQSLICCHQELKINNSDV